MLDDDALRDRALAEARRLVSNVIEGELTVTAQAHSAGWDAFIMRHVFLQPTVAWRRFDDVTVVLDDQGSVVGFRDRNRMEGAEYVALDSAEIARICATTGMLSDRARISRTSRGANNLIEVEFEQEHHRLPRRLRVFINAQLRLVAGLQVVRDP